MELFVSLKGNDAWSGKLSAPNSKKSDGPFLTIEKALMTIADYKKKNKQVPKDGFIINIRKGTYFIGKCIHIKNNLSGSANAPLTITAYKNEKVIFSGGKTITGFEPVADTAVLSRLEPITRNNIVQCNLKKLGITDYGTLKRSGFGIEIKPEPMELIYNGKPMQLAKYPNTGWLKITGAPKGQEGGVFSYSDEALNRWKPSEDMIVMGYWTYDWADTYELVKSFNQKDKTIETYPPHGAYGYKEGARWIALNTLEALDAPGEYYIDRTNGILYFYPPTPLNKSIATATMLEDPFIKIEDAERIVVKGITFENSRGLGINIVNSKFVHIDNCTIRNLGNYAVNIDKKTTNSGIVNSKIYDTADGAIQMEGGVRETLTPGKNYVISNHIYRYQRLRNTYKPAVLLGGVKNYVANNLIHESPHTAILFGGNDHIIEYNEIYNVCLDTNDAGAIYTGRSFVDRGTVIRYNYIHDIGKNPWIHSVYLDDCMSGITVFGNIFHNGGATVFIGGGRDNIIENNIFIGGRPAVQIDARGTNWASFWFNGKDPTIMDGLKKMNHDKPPFSTRYPELVNVLNDEPEKPKHNKVLRNINFSGEWLKLMSVDSNLITLIDNIESADPALVDPKQRRFTLPKNFPLFKKGFKPIPFDKIGLKKK